MRFGAKHNDIFPLLADMIRWQMKLPAALREDRGPRLSPGAFSQTDIPHPGRATRPRDLPATTTSG
jgi:hypothetical protein